MASSHQWRSFKVLTSHMQSKASGTLYPPIKPKYPPGITSSIPPQEAWAIHDKGVELNEIPKVKERLESMAGILPGIKQWHLTPIEEYPGFLEYKKHVTKTHIIEDDPAIYTTIANKTVNDYCNKVGPLIERILSQEQECHSKHHLFNYDEYFEFQRRQQHARNTHVQVGHILQAFYACLGFDNEYLMRSQLSEDVRLETFWKKYGYKEEEVEEDEDMRILRGIDKRKEPIEDPTWPKNIITLQSKIKSSYLVRTEQPLPVFTERDADVCIGDVEEFPYHPSSVFQESVVERPFTVSGHWVGDPCEFHHTSIHVLGDEYEQLKEKHGVDLALEEMKSYIVQAGFTSTASQAHNQGFNQYWDLTYPITSQIVVTDGKYFRFGAYQLNTLHLWKGQEDNPRRNILWLSEPMMLFSGFENGVVQGFNEDVIKKLLSCLLIQPVTPEYDLRPYLTEEKSPLNSTFSINFKGEDLFDIPKIGRYQYPRRAAYF